MVMRAALLQMAGSKKMEAFVRGNRWSAGVARRFIAGETIDIEHYATDLDRLREIAIDSGLRSLFRTERVIDESVRPFYERARYLKAYEKNKGLPLVFGMIFLKSS